MITYILLFILFIILIVVLSFVFAISKTNKNGIEYQVPKKIIKEFNPKIGDDVKFWHNPRNNKLHIYLKGSVGGAGKIGEIDSKVDLKKYENDDLQATICNITENAIFIKYY